MFRYLLLIPMLAIKIECAALEERETAMYYENNQWHTVTRNSVNQGPDETEDDDDVQERGELDEAENPNEKISY